MSEIKLSQAINEFKEYKEALKNGLSPGIITPYSNLNNALRSGIPKNTITTIAAHSGKGKTAFALNLLINAPLLNPGTVVYFLSLEMPATALVARRLSNVTKMTVNEIYDKDLDIDYSLLDDIKDLEFYIDIEAGTAVQLYNRLDLFCKKIPADKDILIALDHSLLIEGKEDKDKTSDLATYSNRLKLKYKNANIILISQLNDAFLKEERVKEKGVRLHPSYNDLYYG